MGKSCSKIILLILILAAWIVVTVRAKKTEEGIILTDAYKKQIMESAEWKKIFLHTENYPDILLEDLKRNPEMLEFVEGYNDVHKKSSEGLTFEERKKKVPLFIQWDKRWGYEPYGTSDERGILCRGYWNILEIHERSCFGLRCNCFAI